MKNISSHNHINLINYFAYQPEDQGDEGRHKCAGCAYIIGYHIGYNNKHYDLESVISMIPDSQAQPQRHHDPKRSANDGFNQGRTDKKEGRLARFSIEEIKNFIAPKDYAKLIS